MDIEGEVMAILHSHHFALKTPNYQALKTFYTETLGFDIVGTIPGKDIVFIDLGGTTIELISTDAELCPKCATGLVHMAFEVDDVDATFEDLKSKGVVFHVAPKGMGDIRMCFFTDPDGNELELFKSPSLAW